MSNYRYSPINESILCDIAVRSIFRPSILISDLDMPLRPVSLWFSNTSFLKSFSEDDSSNYHAILQVSENYLPTSKKDVSELFAMPSGSVYAIYELVILIPGAFNILVDSSFSEATYQLNEMTSQCKYSKALAEKLIKPLEGSAPSWVEMKSGFTIATQPEFYEVILDRIMAISFYWTISSMSGSPTINRLNSLADAFKKTRDLWGQYQTARQLDVNNDLHIKTLRQSLQSELKKIEELLETITGIALINNNTIKRWIEEQLPIRTQFRQKSLLGIPIFNTDVFEALDNELINSYKQLLGEEKFSQKIKNRTMEYLSSLPLADTVCNALWVQYAKLVSELKPEINTKPHFFQIEQSIQVALTNERSNHLTSSFLQAIHSQKRVLEGINYPCELSSADVAVAKTIALHLISYRPEWTSKDKKLKGWKREDQVDFLNQLKCALVSSSCGLEYDDISFFENQLQRLIIDCENQFRNYKVKPMIGYDAVITNLGIFLMYPSDFNNLKRQQDAWKCAHPFIGQGFLAAYLGYSSMSGEFIKPLWAAVFENEKLQQQIYTMLQDWRDQADSSCWQIPTQMVTDQQPKAPEQPKGTEMELASGTVEDRIRMVMQTISPFTIIELKSKVHERYSNITEESITKAYESCKREKLIIQKDKKNGKIVWSWVGQPVKLF